MSINSILIILIGLTLYSYYIGYSRSRILKENRRGSERLHSLPRYYGWLVAFYCALPAIAFLLLWTGLQSHFITERLVASLPEEIQQMDSPRIGLFLNNIRRLAEENTLSGPPDPVKDAAIKHYRQLHQINSVAKGIFIFLVAIVGLLAGSRLIKPAVRARDRVEFAIRILLMMCASIAILTTVGIVLSVLVESIRFFNLIPFSDFLFGLKWSPQTAIRTDQVGSSGAFGAIPLFAGTALISVIALTVAVPVGLMSAIYISEYATQTMRAIAKPMLEILAGIPTVVYGFFAALTVAPFIREIGERIGLTVASESALAAGLVIGIMIIPFVSSLADDVISVVPQTLRDGSYALGATKSETILQVVIPAALPGVVGGILLAASRAIGETMIVVMAAGLSAKLTANPLEAVTTVTVQIVTLLTGDQEFDSAKTLSAFALALILFAVTLLLNIFALHIVRKYREQYD